MKTELRLRRHAILTGAIVAELWHDGVFVGEVTGREDGPGVRVISKHPIEVGACTWARGVMTMEVEIKP